MDNQNSKIFLITRLTWVLIALSLTSCLVRSDYNVLFGFVILTIIVRYYYSEKKLYLKIILHFLVLASIFDLLWFIIVIPSWSSGEEASDYWKSFSFLRGIAIFFSFVEFGVKGGIGYFAYLDFTNSFPNETDFLTNFEYQIKK